VLRIDEVPFDHPDSEMLRTAQQDEIAVIYGRPDSEPGPKPSTADITVFFVGYEDDRPAVCGGLRDLGDDIEIKRMYVVPARRGSGAAVAMLHHLEHEARYRGFRRVVLETGTEQTAAIRLYEREGYEPIPLFGHYVGSDISLCYAKPL
jgi:ribosomal protein S18 acetylase RimI-like enzyme